MSWNLTELKENANKLYGPARKELINDSARSIIERQNYAHYHFDEASSQFNVFFENRKSLRESVDLVFRRDGSGLADFDCLMLGIQAHILGFMQSLHSVSDILSHVIYYSLDLQSTEPKLPLSRLTIHTLLSVIKRKFEYDYLSVLIEELSKSGEYQYLADLVNHSKHRGVIAPFFNVNLENTEGEHHEIKFSGFNFGDKKYAPRLVFEFVEAEFNRQCQLIIDIGNELNRLVAKKLEHN